MKTETEVKNQQAINEFFDAFGVDTAKEYSNSIIDLISMVAASTNTNLNFREDLLAKLKDLNELILQLGKTENITTAPFPGVYINN